MTLLGAVVWAVGIAIALGIGATDGADWRCMDVEGDSSNIEDTSYGRELFACICLLRVAVDKNGLSLTGADGPELSLHNRP